ncbi:hypothetical protein ACS0TY_002405 [Phlomoides rotata]
MEIGGLQDFIGIQIGLKGGFCEAIDDYNLSGVVLIGYQFTWFRGRGSSHLVEERLDRAMGTPSWHDRFPQACLINLVAPVSDHNPVLLQMETLIFRRRHKRFKFENKWLLEDALPSAVRRWRYKFKVFPSIGFCKEASVDDSLNGVMDSVVPLISANQNAELVGEFEIDAFRRTVSQMHPDKSPWSDGFNSTFYQHFWGVIGGDVY